MWRERVVATEQRLGLVHDLCADSWCIDVYVRIDAN